MRQHNAEAMRALASRSVPRFLWKHPFLAMPNSKVMSAFAQPRTYTFEGREVDRQTHLGFDLAAVAEAPVPAANDGIVVFAGYLGIYGNTVDPRPRLRPHDHLRPPVVALRRPRDRRWLGVSSSAAPARPVSLRATISTSRRCSRAFPSTRASGGTATGCATGSRASWGRPSHSSTPGPRSRRWRQGEEERHQGQGLGEGHRTTRAEER